MHVTALTANASTASPYISSAASPSMPGFFSDHDGAMMHAKYMHELCSLLMHIPTYYNAISCYNHDLQ
jgi:hypothetical protein